MLPNQNELYGVNLSVIGVMLAVKLLQLHKHIVFK